MPASRRTGGSETAEVDRARRGAGGDRRAHCSGREAAARWDGAVRRVRARRAWPPPDLGRSHRQAAGPGQEAAAGPTAEPASGSPPFLTRRDARVTRPWPKTSQVDVRGASRVGVHQAGVWCEVVDDPGHVGLRKAEAGGEHQERKQRGESDQGKGCAPHESLPDPFQKTPPGVTDAHLRALSACPSLGVASSFVEVEIGATGEQTDAGTGEPDGEDSCCGSGHRPRRCSSCAARCPSGAAEDTFAQSWAAWYCPRFQK